MHGPIDHHIIEIVQRLEGFEPVARDDGFGTITVGYGATGVGVYEGQRWTQEQALNRLHSDLAIAAGAVDRIVDAPLRCFEFGALVSFTFNVGETAFGNSHLAHLLNTGRRDLAPLEFQRWVYSKGRMVRGLQNRRRVEEAWFRAGPECAKRLLDHTCTSDTTGHAP